MEFAKAEMAALELVGPAKNEQSGLVDLAELQLALVGGGVGDVILG